MILDEEGSELASLEAARAEARASAQDLVMDDLRSGRRAPERRIEITDDHGAFLDSVGISVLMN
jgi:hypothetical protein